MARFPLRTHLVVLVVGTLLPVLLLTGFLVAQLVKGSQEEIERSLLETARSGATVVDAELVGIVRVLQALAQSDDLPAADFAAFRDEARHVQASETGWADVVLVARDGHAVMNAAEPLGDDAPAPIDLAILERVMTAGRPVIGDLQKRTDASGRFAFPVSVPVFGNGRVQYVLSAIVTPDYFNEVLRRQQPLSDEWVRGVVDARGLLVARTRDAERFTGQRGTQEFLKRVAEAPEGVYQDTSLDGRPVYGAYVRAPLSRWVAGVAVPADNVESGFRGTMTAFAGIGVVLLGVAGFAAFRIARTVSGDISRAARAADALAQGKQPAVPNSTVLEVHQLSTALTHSATLLAERERERDDQIRRAEEARSRAEAADRAKDEFLAMLGHELRNPLAPALTALELMRLRGETSSVREREVLDRQVRHLARLVDDLLDVSRLRRGRVDLQPEPVEISEAIERAVEISRPLISDRGHHLIIDVPKGIIVHGDATRLAQVFSNLLTNSAKYTDSHGHLTIRASVEDGAAVIRCEDDGMGISAELMPHVFEAFAQGRRALDRKEGGLGLGLAVVKNLVELHRGTIEVHSAGPGLGSTFIVRLPLAADGVRSTLPSDWPRTNDGQGSRVLVVDDNRDAAETLAETLRLHRFEVATAHDGFEALKTLEDFQPDVALLDIGLPTMSGFELARRIRENDPDRGIWLVAVTGYGQQADADACYEAGFDLHVVKPITTEALFDVVCPPDRDLEHPA